MTMEMTEATILAEAESELWALETESKEMPQRLSSIARLGESEALIECNTRRTALPSLIFAAKVRMKRAQIALFSSQHEQAQADAQAARQQIAKEVPGLTEEMEELNARMLELQQRYDVLIAEEHYATFTAQNLARALEHLDRELERLIQQQVGMEPESYPGSISQYREQDLEALALAAQYGQVRVDNPREAQPAPQNPQPMVTPGRRTELLGLTEAGRAALKRETGE